MKERLEFRSVKVTEFYQKLHGKRNNTAATPNPATVKMIYPPPCRSMRGRRRVHDRARREDPCDRAASLRPGSRLALRAACPSAVTKSPYAWIITSPFGRRSNNAGSACPIVVWPNTRARPIDCMPPEKHSDALPLMASTRIATGPSYTDDRLAAGIHRARIRDEVRVVVTRLHRAERFHLADEMSRDAHHHRCESTGIAAQVEDDAVAAAKPVHRTGERSRRPGSSRR